MCKPERLPYMGAGGMMLRKVQIAGNGFFLLLLFSAAFAVILHPIHARSQSSVDEKSLYERSVGNPTVENLREYLKAFPLGDHREEVKKLLDQQMEAMAWDRAKSGNTREALTAYMDLYPAGAHVAEARRMIAALDANTGMHDYPNTALNGIVSATIAATPSACRAQCGERMDCAGYSVTSDNSCHLFSSINSARAEASSVAATRQPVPGYAAPANGAAGNPPAAQGLKRVAPVTECDRLTASSNDPEKPAGVTGVRFDLINPAAAVRACQAAMTDYPDEPRFQYEMGRAYDRDSNHQQALKFYRKAFDMNYDVAAVGLGYAYQYGVGVEKDYSKALEIYNKVFERGGCAVCENLATLYEDGHGVPQDYSKAIELNEKAISYNIHSTVAYSNLAYMYYDGLGVQKNFAKAFELFSRGAANGPWGGTYYALAMMYEGGQGVAQDSNQSAYWMEKALRDGFEFARDQMRSASDGRWSSGFRQALQVRLHRAGVYDGPIDGSFGPMTQNAIDRIFSNY
jgi:TPR repeat protein